jgi:hypothetical protein
VVAHVDVTPDRTAQAAVRAWETLADVDHADVLVVVERASTDQEAGLVVDTGTAGIVVDTAHVVVRVADAEDRTVHDAVRAVRTSAPTVHVAAREVEARTATDHDAARSAVLAVLVVHAVARVVVV